MADRTPLVGMLNALPDQGQGVPLAGMPDPQVNVPFGELSVPHYSPSQRLGNAAQDALEWLGAKPQIARHLVEGLGGVLGLSPAAVPVAAADLIDAKSRGDIGGTAQAALGMIPGAGAVERKVAEVAEPVIRGIRAYHGSPHDFDKFDLSKIGTGEGAQAYGHGLYFAENPSVAGSYRNLAPPHQNVPDEVKQALGSLDNLGFDSRAQALHEINANPDWMQRWGIDPSRSEGDAKAAETIQQFLKDNPRGRGYEVNIKADPEQFLDWDKPLYEQPAYDKIKAHADQIRSMGLEDIYRHFLDAAEMRGMHGSDFVNVAKSGGHQALSADLKDAGIPGIKYLDRGSRMADDGTSNYVVFDPSIVDIIRKYGLAGAVPTGAISAGMLAQPSNDQPAL